MTDKTLLTIDDARLIRSVVKQCAAKIDGIRVIEAPDGEKGLEMIEAERPDLVLLDFNMPGLNGMQVLEALRAHLDPDVQKTRVVMLTTEAKRETVYRLVKLGVQDYLIKPFDRVQLEAKLQEMLA